MSVDILKLKALAEAAKRDQYDNVALNDYGMAMPPAVTLELIAEIERHRQVNAEGSKPEISILPCSVPCAGAAVGHGLDKAEGWKPDLIIPPRNATMQTVVSEIKAADNELVMAQVGLLAAVRRSYPTGCRLLIQAGRNKVEVEVTGHCDAWWSRPGYIYGKNRKTNKARTFHHSHVVGVLP
jgi:hypothetical protein